MAELKTVTSLPGGDEPENGSFSLSTFGGIPGLQGGQLVANFGYGPGVGHNLAKLVAGAGFQFFDAPEGYGENWRQGEGGTVTRPMVGPWSQFRAFRDYMLGYSYNLPDPNNLVTIQDPDNPGFTIQVPDPSNPARGVLKRAVPSQHPKEPQLYCVGVQLVRGDGAPTFDPDCVAEDRAGNAYLTTKKGPDGSPLFNPVTGQPTGGPIRLPFIYYVENRAGVYYDGYCHVLVSYGHLPFIVKDDSEIASDPMKEAGRWVEWKRNDNIQAIQVPAALAAQLKFIDDASVPQNLRNTVIPSSTPMLLLPTSSIEATWWDVPDLNFEVFENLEAKLNPEAWPPSFHPMVGNPKPRGTVLFQPVRFERYRGPLGNWTHKVTVNGLFRKVGWNAFPSAPNFAFYNASFGGSPSGPTLYQYPVDPFRASDLFTLPAPQPYQ